MKKFITSLLITLTFLVSGCGIYKRSDVKDNPVNVDDRVKRNIEEGRGITFFDSDKKKGGGTFDFASSNELWRASLDVLDFVTFTNASYSGGILITDWFKSDSKQSTDNNRSLKITVRFLSNEIRSDAIKISIHEKKCSVVNSCSVKKINSKLENTIKLAILENATLLKSNFFKKNKEKFLKSGKKTTVIKEGNN